MNRLRVSFAASCAAQFFCGCPTTPATQDPDPADSGRQVENGAGAPQTDGGETQALDAGQTDATADAGRATFDAGINNVPSPDAGTTPPPAADCGDDDPLTNFGWVGFCGDRVDDNCRVDHPDADCTTGVYSHEYCNTGDEECPATQPASAPPTWDCATMPVPDNVIAYAHFTESNEQVQSFCVFVYESTAFAGEHYVATAISDGSNTSGPNSLCAADKSARRHFYLSDLVDEIAAATNCAPVRCVYDGSNVPVDDQKLSNHCRRAMRNVARGAQAEFIPEIQYFAASREEATAKLDILESVEIACLGIDRNTGEPYRVGEIWVTQAVKELTRVP
ncbi:MAG: hypothetical protein GY822_00720 [Deltaproteobacteria bacterium]|nr:hypothetical protein [Deltaproteobacteria bacterium]